jgi:hypothetical protein
MRLDCNRGDASLSGGGGVQFTEVATYSLLPDPDTLTVGTLYLVQTSTGVWPINRKAAGIYQVQVGGSPNQWTWLGDAPVAASQISFVANTDITSVLVQDAIVEVRDDTDVKLSGKIDKTVLASADDLLISSAANTPAALAIGSDTQVLTVNTAATPKIQWKPIPAPAAPAASAVSFTPDGDIAATNVQAAVTEVRDDTDIKLTGKISNSLVTNKGSLVSASAAGAPADLPVGTDGWFLKANSAATLGINWASVSLPYVPARETIISNTVSTTDISNAIAALSALGGGTIWIDGLHELTGNITMASNVIVRGYGAGSGFRNSTANGYAINLVGTTPTERAVTVSQSAPYDYFTCNTVAQASDFTAGNFAYVRSASGSDTAMFFKLVRIKTTGNTGTGKVEIFGGNFDNGVNTPGASQKAGALSFGNCSLLNLKLVNASSGSLKVRLDYATNIIIQDVLFEESKLEINYSGLVDIFDCDFLCDATKNFAGFAEIVAFSDTVHFQNCNLIGALKGIYTTGTFGQINDLIVSECLFNGICNPIYFTDASSPVPVLQGFRVFHNKFENSESPASGSSTGAGSYGIYLNLTCIGFDISSNEQLGGDWFLYSGGPSKFYFGSISCNSVHGLSASTGLIEGRGQETWTSVIISGNVCRGISEAATSSFIGIHGYMTGLSVVGNDINGLIKLTNIDGADRYIRHSTVSGNRALGLTLGSHASSAATNVANVSVTGNELYGGDLDCRSNCQYISIVGNQIVGNLLMAGAAGRTASNVTIVGNIIQGNLTFTALAQNDITIQTNRIAGVVTAPYGETVTYASSNTMWGKASVASQITRKYTLDANGFGGGGCTEALYAANAQPAETLGFAARFTLDDTLAVANASTEIACIRCGTTDVTNVVKHAIHIGTDFDQALHVASALPLNPAYGYTVVNSTNVATDHVASGGGGDDSFINTAVNTELFVNNSDYVLIGNSAVFRTVKFSASVLSSVTITPTFEYSTGDGTWATLTVIDGTLGFTLNGVITFVPPVGWAATAHFNGPAGTAITSGYYIRIRRTRATVATKPTESFFKIYATSSSTDMSVNGDGSVTPASLADTSAANNTIYYSTTASKLVFKDSAGTVNVLY